MKKDITAYIEFDNLDLELLICTDILKLNSLHYGYWDIGEKLSLENLGKAQARYTQKLISFVPPEVRTVLDVGCGIGDNALALADRGYSVTAVSPDKNHKKYFERLGSADVAFIKQRYEDLNLDQKFDLILMSESQNYFDAGIGFCQCQRFLNDGGYLLVCGMFRKKNLSVFEHVRNIESEFIATAAGHGLELIKHLDITDHVLPTLRFANRTHKEYLLPSFSVLNYYLSQTSPLKLRLLMLFCSKELKNLRKIYEYYREFCDPVLFQKHVKYLTLLFTLGKRRNEHAC